MKWFSFSFIVVVRTALVIVVTLPSLWEAIMHCTLSIYLSVHQFGACNLREQSIECSNW